MPRCTRKGCQKEYSDEDEECSYHTGAPVFHEGLKSWSCCQDVNKPVLDFDSFMTLPGCTKGKHTSARQTDASLQTAILPPGSARSAAGPSKSSMEKASVSTLGTETYSTASLNPIVSPSSRSVNAPAPPPAIEDEDELEVAVAPGTTCLRLGCKAVFVSDEASRLGDGDDAHCVYHPSAPIFREGSKGYLCCKKRVLDFDDFLKIEGCKTGRHVFVKKAQPGAPEEVKCRIEHYQTPSQVHVSVFAKKIVKEKSSVDFEAEQVHLDLMLPDNKRFVRSLPLFGRINPTTSTFTYHGTKVELILAKSDGRSWNMLEKPAGENVLPQGYNITFGVSGRTGSVGAKMPILSEDNKVTP